MFMIVCPVSPGVRAAAAWSSYKGSRVAVVILPEHAGMAQQAMRHNTTNNAAQYQG
ncbi:hypothetical protein T11_7514 [Trichinella zimbabwensis]|uniref:Uncharacterized protein n=1 Tax=Trichinella zimbabwensis TaxID=268475 RepID=A0A0V1GYD6_9BILA|nr:hypothetical protein T11_7514 [Trichinella zimbabwensis]